MRVLVVEDDMDVAANLSQGLRSAGHEVDHTDDGGEGLIRASDEEYDAIIMDRMLPSVDGLAVVRSLRQSGVQTPVLILSALTEVDDRIKGLRAGADDYLGKPFSIREVLARLDVLAGRRTIDTERMIETGLLRVGDLELDIKALKARRGERQIEMQPREAKILEYLMRRAGQVVTRSMLLEDVWDIYFDPQASIVDVHIHRLGRKIDQGAPEPLLQMIPHVGYCLRPAAA